MSSSPPAAEATEPTVTPVDALPEAAELRVSEPAAAERSDAEPPENARPAKWRDPASWRRAALARWCECNRLPLAAAAAVMFHVLTVWIATGGLAALLVAVLPSWLLPQAAQAGDAAGVLEGVNVEMIDEADLKQRYISLRPGKDPSDAEPASPEQAPRPPQQAAAAAEAQPVTPPPAAETIEQAAEMPDGNLALRPTKPVETKPEPAKPEPPRQDLPTPAPAPKVNTPKALTKEEIAEIVAATRLDADNVTMTVSSAAAARRGETNPFVRDVLRLLKLNMPKWKGGKGEVVIQLIVSMNGDIEAMRVGQSSGNAELDRFVFDRVRATKLIAPGKEISPHQRTFQITYHYE